MNVVGPDDSARERYLPKPKNRRAGVALCLSGGGYRAALHHLGGLTRLNELGVLPRVDTISAVSGGSIFAAFLAQRLRPWPAEPLTDWNERVAEPFRAFTSKNIRTAWVLRRALPWRWFDSTVAVESLARRYRRDVVQLSLAELPERPSFVFSATDMSFGVNWVSERTRVGSYMAGHTNGAPDWPAARAVAASSCFPPVFDPLPTGLEPAQLTGGMAPAGPKRDALVRGLRLSDGGVYDNMGLEPVWKDHATLLVSDGGATFDFEPDAGLFKRLGRYQGIVGRQAGAVRKRWLIASFQEDVMDGAYWGIGSHPKSYDRAATTYPDELIDEVISEVRTDLDRFSEAEASVLVNHGYLLADVAVRKHAPGLIAREHPAAVPHPDWMDAARVAGALRTSGKRKLLGRWR
jgi:NTE family protein